MARDYGIVKSQHGLARCLLPIYGFDQLVVVTLFVFLLLLFGIWNSGAAFYVAGGVYVGITVSMWRSTPCHLLLPASAEESVTTILDNARLLRRSDRNNEWISVRGRLRRWGTDTIRLARTRNGLLVTGRRYDLAIIAARVET
jgi:hypothetical protein